MKAIIKFCIAIVAFLIFSFEGFSQAPTSGLVAYYPLDGNANDASGNGRNGVISGGVTPTIDRLGVANQAYVFNGINGYINVSNWNILSGNSARTMMLWFKSAVPVSNQYLLSWGNWAASSYSAIGTFFSGSTRNLGFVGWGNELVVLDQLQYYDNRWHFIAATFDGSVLSLYLDGILLQNRTTTLNTTLTPWMRIGLNYDRDFFNGAIDDVRIYNRSLTATEVQQTYIAEAATTSTAEIIKLGADRVFSMAGTANTMLGLRAGAFSTGNYNTFLGSGGVGLSTTGNENVFIGYKTGLNTSGSYNTFIGNSVGIKNTTGQNNVYVGWSSGFENTIGGDNTALGTQAGGLTTTGSNNTSFGKLSGYNNTTGSLNTYLGAGADGFGTNRNNLSNATAIGANAKVSISNAIVLGDTANVSLKVGIGTKSPSRKLEVRSGNPNESGIRTTNLTATSPTISGNGKVLTVNTLGDIILVPDGGSGTNTHSDTVWVRTATNTNYIGGNVGIGIPIPQFKLDVAGPINIRGINGNQLLKLGSVNFLRGDKNFNGAFGFDAEVNSNYYHSTAIGYKAFANADNVLVLGGVKENAVNVGIGNSAPKDRLEITSGKEGESGLSFSNLNQTFQTATTSDKFLSVNKFGKVGLYNLSASQVLVKIDNPYEWSDKVFESNHQLKPLNELEAYIVKNGHLPNIPSADEMMNKGFSVQVLLAKLLENQEEMTLHILQQNRINLKQAKEIETLKKLIKKSKKK